MISLRVSRRGITSHDSGPVRFSRFGSTSRGSCLARFARLSRKVFKSIFDRRSIDFQLTSDTCSILRPATTRDGSLRPETTRYDRRRFACGSHGSVSRVTVRMVLTVRFHKSRFALFSWFSLGFLLPQRFWRFGGFVVGLVRGSLQAGSDLKQNINHYTLMFKQNLSPPL